jgi:FKBP-type peptidyl-prolyl cis-trans isomerase SlyD
MTISKDKVISVTYELKVNGTSEVVEVVNEENPLTFILGSGSLLKSFEDNLTGLDKGNDFDFVLASNEAYGPVNEQAIMDIPVSSFMIDGKLDDKMIQLGNTIPMKDTQGRQFNGKIVGITDENVKMDFNHPMAGKDLNFKGKVVDIREATPEELANGLHGSGCSGCGDSDGCNDSSCGSCGC